MYHENIRLWLPTQRTTTWPTVSAQSSELSGWEADNVLIWTKPSKGWQTNSVTADGTVDFADANRTGAILIDRINVPEVKTQKYTSSTWDSASMPNVILWSHQIRRDASASGVPESPWSNNTGSNSVDPLYEAGPDTKKWAQRIQWGSSTPNDIRVTRVMELTNADKYCAFSVWMRSLSGAVSMDVCLISGATTLTATYTLTSKFERYTVFGKIVTGGTTTIQGSIRISGAQQTVFGGAQLTVDTDAVLDVDYETRGNGLYIPVDDRTGQRKLLIIHDSFKNFLSQTELRVTIPANQTPDNEDELYVIGNIVIARRYGYEQVDFPGKFGWPLKSEVLHGGTDIKYPSGARGVLRPGIPRMKFSIDLSLLNAWAAEVDFGGYSATGQVMPKLTRLSKADPFILFENTRPPGGRRDIRDPTKAYLVRKSSNSRLSYPLAEVMSSSLEVEEVI